MVPKGSACCNCRRILEENDVRHTCNLSNQAHWEAHVGMYFPAYAHSGAIVCDGCWHPVGQYPKLTVSQVGQQMRPRRSGRSHVKENRCKMLLPPNDPQLLPVLEMLARAHARIRDLEAEVNSLKKEVHAATNIAFSVVFPGSLERMLGRDALVRSLTGTQPCSQVF